MATRRSFVQKLIGAVTLGLLPGAALAQRQKMLVYDVVHDPDHYVAGQWSLPPETPRLYFNGEDWTCRAVECHAREGWVIAFDTAPDPIAPDKFYIEHPPVRRKHFGKVELRAA
jgi:hypothetical protein